jgi:hypothetical protein
MPDMVTHLHDADGIATSDEDDDGDVSLDDDAQMDRKDLYKQCKRLARVWTEFWEMVFERNPGFATQALADAFQVKYNKWLESLRRTITQTIMTPYMHIGSHGAEHGHNLYQIIQHGQGGTMNEVVFFAYYFGVRCDSILCCRRWKSSTTSTSLPPCTEPIAAVICFVRCSNTSSA